MKKVLSGILVLLALVPIITVSGTLFPTVNGKIVAYRLAACVVCGIMTYLAWREPLWLQARLRRAWASRLFRVLTISTGLLIISTALAADRFVAFFGEPMRNEGFLTLFALYILYVGLSLGSTYRSWKHFFMLTGVSTTVIFAYELWQRFHGNTRPYSLIGNPIFLAAFYLFSFFAGYCLVVLRERRLGAKNKLKRLAPIAGTIIMAMSFIGIALTKTRGTLLGLAVASVIGAVIAIYIGRERRVAQFSLRTIGTIVIGALLLFGAVFGLTYRSPIWQSVPGLDRVASSDATNVDSRLVFLKISLTGYAKSSVLRQTVGWGWDNYQFFWDKNYDPVAYLYDTATPDRAHDKLLDMLIMTGALGFIAYLALWYFFFVTAWKILRADTALGLGLVFFGVSYVVHNLFAFDTPVVLFALYAVLAFMTQYPYEEI